MDQRQRGLTGHVTAVEQPGPEEWQGVFPCPLDDIPEFVTVALLGAAESDDHVRSQLARARSLKVWISSKTYSLC